MKYCLKSSIFKLLDLLLKDITVRCNNWSYADRLNNRELKGQIEK